MELEVVGLQGDAVERDVVVVIELLRGECPEPVLLAYLEAARAEQQIMVARFYYSRGAYIAAINRSKVVLNKYGEGPQVEDALGIMFLSYQQMQMADLASDTRRIIELNYPASRFLSANIKPGGSWLSRLF